MFFEALLFFIAAAGALGGALGVVLLRNPFYSVLALVSHLLALAVLFLLLQAEFLAAAQVVVYAGAVMVLYLFVVAYVGGADEPLDGGGAEVARRLGPLFAAVLLVEVAIAVIGSGLSVLGTEGTRVSAEYGVPGQIGRLLLERFLIAFEAASFLLLVAAVGAVVLARRRRGLEESPGPLTAQVGYRPDTEDPATAGGGSGPGSKPTEERVPATAEARA
jgi:NADH:ubiquinone oxidoreductase subunit 6 (subunit J)